MNNHFRSSYHEHQKAVFSTGRPLLSWGRQSQRRRGDQHLRRPDPQGTGPCHARIRCGGVFSTEDRATRGSAEYSSVYQNATYRFKSEANRQKFEQQPQKYAPQFGGYCAFGVSVGAKFDGDPEFWKIVDGKLYLNLNQEIQKNWLKDTSGNIDKARAQWKKIAKVAPAKLK